MSLSKREAFVISAFTDVLMIPFDEYHKLVEEEMGKPVLTHQMGSKAFAAEIRECVRPEFIKICSQFWEDIPDDLQF